MTSWQVRRARATRLFGFALALAGFVSTLVLLCQSFSSAAWLAGVGAWLPLHKLAWLPRELYGSLALAVLGLAVMTLGAAISRAQLVVLEAASRDAEDRLRRVSQYDGERLEPFIGRVIDVAELDEAIGRVENRHRR